MTDQILTKKLELIQWLSTVESKVILDKIIEIKKKDVKVLSFTLRKNEVLSIEHGLKDFENGKVKPHERVKKIYEKWL